MINTAGRRGLPSRIAPFLLVAAIALVAVINVAECRIIRENQLQLNHQQKRAVQNDEFQNDGATDGEEDDTGNSSPVILSDSMVIEATEGSTAQFPCKVTQGSLDEFVLLWINGTKTIMTDGEASTPNPRYSQSKNPLEKTLVIEGVTRWDSGTYTCKITSEPPVEITHTLRVLHSAKIMSIKAVGAVESTTSGGLVKKFTVKQGEPIQLICNVDGNPEPKVHWIKRVQSNTQPQGRDQSLVSSQQPSTIVVSNTNEFRIENTNAFHDAGHYECVTQNKQGTDPPTTSEMELVIEYPPEITVHQPVVNTGETYTAQLVCTVFANPKVKVTWEKEQVVADGALSFVQLSTDNPDRQYETFRRSSKTASTTPTGTIHELKVKQVVSPRDFGRYRCKAENKLGHSYSGPITLTGTPASPQQPSVHLKSNMPELGWVVDSWSPMLEYQLQFKRQQDPSTSWLDLRPQPTVINPSKDTDERRYEVSYLFDENKEQSTGKSTYEPLSIQRGTTYVARIRARNQHGWSDWSEDVVFSGVNFNEWSNEINQNGDPDVSKASVGGTSGAQRLRYCGATVLAIASALAACRCY